MLKFGVLNVRLGHGDLRKRFWDLSEKHSIHLLIVFDSVFFILEVDLSITSFFTHFGG